MLMLLKARSENTTCQFKAGCYEILSVAQAMHDKMVSLNRDRQTVLAESVACGWLAWRPDNEGKLVNVHTQTWCKPFPLTSSRMGEEMIANRFKFLDEGDKPMIEDAATHAPDAALLQTSYFEPQEAAQTLELECEQALVDGDDMLVCHAAMMHPGLRTTYAATMADLALITSQKSKAKKQPKPRL